MKQVIAIVEDDANQRRHYAEALRGHDYEVREFAARKEAIDAFEQEMPDMAILDIILGNEVGGGFEVCRYLKERDSQFPIIFLTSRGDELDKIYGLQLGAWDYQTKPVSLDFLTTRVQSLFQIQGLQGQRTASEHCFGELVLDEASMAVRWRGEPVNLTPTEFELLREIVNQPGGVSIEELVRATRQGVVEDNTINTHILHVRKKFKQVDPDFACIKTRYGFGYGWIC